MPASWVVAIENHSVVRSEIRWRIHTQAKLATSATNTSTSATGWTSPSRSHALNTSARLGAKM
jgi:hypothetical protein